MLYRITTSTDILSSLLNDAKDKLRYAELYVEADTIDSALLKARKYLNDNKGSDLSILEVKSLSGILLV